MYMGILVLSRFFGPAHAEDTEAEAAEKIDAVWSQLFKEPLWVPSEKAKQISMKAFRYLELYMNLAKLAFQQNEMMWLFNSKAHMLSHIFKNFNWEAEMGPLALNPLALGVQMEEDMVGKSARINRRVSPPLQIQRTIQRYLAGSFAVWHDAEMIDRVGD